MSGSLLASSFRGFGGAGQGWLVQLKPDPLGGKRSMAHLVLAKLVVALHFGFVAFVFAGAYIAVSHRWVVSLHVPAIAYAILITVVGWSCPLTILEQRLLERAGAPVYSGEFLPHYVWSRFGLTGSEVSVAVGLIVVLAAVSARPYWLIFRAGP